MTLGLIDIRKCKPKEPDISASMIMLKSWKGLIAFIANSSNRFLLHFTYRWVVSIIAKANRATLTTEDIYEILPEVESKTLTTSFQE